MIRNKMNSHIRSVSTFPQPTIDTPKNIKLNYRSIRTVSTTPWPTIDNPSPYQVFGLPPTSNQTEIKRRYSARLYHPDHQSSRKYTGRFQKVAEAYELLSDPRRRKAYDKFGIGWPNTARNTTKTPPSFHHQKEIYKQWYGYQYDAFYANKESTQRPPPSSNNTVFIVGFTSFFLCGLILSFRYGGPTLIQEAANRQHAKSALNWQIAQSEAKRLYTKKKHVVGKEIVSCVFTDGEDGVCRSCGIANGVY
ncbi:J domain-containing protein 1 [Neolecta irregularis DAH-3]|uniref:J domain-containing protein 1 n=1 Tax=Neolecta irregularis (strain DAH-3) TaxID=1198029 RepID=A0A1U7LWN7_NEOID|nr:J domain-containing protein 1 [Neolecta irregularis DAH-3]|eukprot:OLL27095.1 J domain-containing protein 1 [Neolecta irregularis DAH-3]